MQEVQPEIAPLTRQQKRYAARQAAKAERNGVIRDGKGIVLNVVKVPSKGIFRIQERGTMNIMRNRRGDIIEFPTAEAAHAALIRLKEMNEKNVQASTAEVVAFRADVARQIEAARKEGVVTGLEGTPYDPEVSFSTADSDVRMTNDRS